MEETEEEVGVDKEGVLGFVGDVEEAEEGLWFRLRGCDCGGGCGCRTGGSVAGG